MKNISEPTVSVVVPVYNVEDYLVGCIDSVTEQTYKNLEIILVDDGATDSSGRMCDEIAETDSRIKVIHKKKRRAFRRAKCRHRGRLGRVADVC